MKTFWYAALIAALVPIQVVLMPYVSVWNVKPDIGLIAVCLIGFLGGELQGLLVGLVMGWMMSLLSAEDLGSSMLIKGAVGLVSGVAGRQIAHVTPMVVVVGLFVGSCLAGLAMAASLRLSPEQDLWWAARAVILPQACFDAVVGGTIYWLAWGRLNIERFAWDQGT
jgi:rod shape-determining protein MreD